MWQQRTLKEPVKCTGLGLHSGQVVTMTLRPSAANRGVVFRRVDLPGQPEIPAGLGSVADSNLATTLGLNGTKVGCDQHLLPPLAGTGVDNLTVDLDGPEVPIMDGSAAPFMLLLKSVGQRRLDEARQIIRIKKQIRVSDGDRFVELKPSTSPRVNCTIEFDHPLLGTQHFEMEMDVRNFDREISRARTFGFLEDVIKLKKAGLAKGGSLDNAIVIDRFQILNPSGLRFDDEFVRHKILDLIGDLSLLGKPIFGDVWASKSGHALNHALLKKLLSVPRHWEVVTLTEEMSPASERTPVSTPARLGELAAA